MRNPLRARRKAELDRREAYRAARRLADEDVTVFGESLSQLHVETLTDVLSEEMRTDYRSALGAYDEAKLLLGRAETVADIPGVADVLVEGRFRLACVIARRDGSPLPERRDPCFFNPQHGPASRDVSWTPPAGVARQIPVCFGCVQRLEAGEPPDQRLVRHGDRWVPWYAAGGTSEDLGGIDAHVVRGSAWTSRTHEAEALTRGAAQILGGGVS